MCQQERVLDTVLEIIIVCVVDCLSDVRRDLFVAIPVHLAYLSALRPVPYAWSLCPYSLYYNINISISISINISIRY